MKIPPNFKDLLPLPLETLRQLAQVVGQPQLLNKLKEAAELVGGKDASAMESIQQVFQQASKWAEVVANPSSWSKASSMEREGVNGTGELFTSRWTNGAIAPQAALRGAQLSSNPTLSNQATGDLRLIILGLTGASEAIVAVNTSAALHALALSDPNNKQWLIPRVDSVRPFRFGTANNGSLRASLDLAQRRVIEIGSNQECTESDFDQGIPLGQSAILSVSPGNATGIRASRDAQQSTWVEILYNGSLHTVEQAPEIALGIEERWLHGPDILLVPCDLWLGGPEACLILSRTKSEWWNALERTLQGAGLEASAWTQAILHQVLKSSEDRNRWEESGAGAAVTTSLENLRFRAQKIASQLEGATDLESVSIAEKKSRLGMGLWSETKLDGIVLQLKPKGQSASALAERLAAPPKDCNAKPLWCNVLSDHIEIVLRTIPPADDATIVQHFFPTP